MNILPFFIYHKDAFIKITGSEIDHIEGGDRFSKIYIGDKFYISNLMLSELALLLSKFNFLRIGHSYIIPLHKIDAITIDSIILGKKEITIGRKTAHTILKKINLLSKNRFVGTIK